MKKLIYLAFALFIAVFVFSCKEDDAPLPDNTINFSAAELGIDESETSKNITITIDRSSTSALSVVIGITETGIVYDENYTTSPAASNGTITVSIPAGQTTASIAIQKAEGKFFDGSETLSFSIATVPEELVLGSTTALKVTFGAIVSAGSELTLNGGEGGASAVNSVYVDLSNNEQTAVARKSWNLGLYCGDGFGAIINNTTASTAKAVDIAIDAIVNSADSASYATALTISQMSPSSIYFGLIDDWSRDLTKSVIKEGKVYVVNLGESQTPLYKVKVTLKDANTYTLQYAKINESTVKTIDIAKNSNYEFVYASFVDNQIVSVAPPKAKWDIVWGKFFYQTTYNGELVPYSYSDMVFINTKAGTKAVEVVSSDDKINTAAFASFTLTNADTLTFSSDVDVIGSKWRNGGGPTTPPSVKADRFYVIKDSAGNAYKLQFVSMGPGDGGTRGYPNMKYELLK